MKAKVNIRDFIEDNLSVADHRHMLSVHASVEIDDLLDTNGIPEEHAFDIDIHELLAENRQIAHIWGIDDAQEVRPDLDDDQAWQVLQDIERHLDSQYGITWDTLKIMADELYGPKPERRWHGRIDVTITDTDGYGQSEAINRLRDMADLLAKDMPDVKANADEGSVKLVEEAQP
jgi:hypothetical protein